MENVKLKIALIGYGAMGKEIEKTAKRNGIVITDIFELDSKISSSKKYDFDVAIDFGYSEFVRENVEVLSKLNKNIVIGTTGWEKDLIAIKELIKKSDIGCIYGSNFSIGIQMFQRITELACKLMNNIDGYDIMLHELHHKNKKDSPSGTALLLAKTILKNNNLKDEIITDKCEERISSNQLHVSSTRGGEIIGIHSIYLDSLADTIELTHRAKNRTGFAVGAVSAAKWIHKKKGLFQFNDMLDDLWREINV